MKPLILAIALSLQMANAAAPTVPPIAVQEILKPILDLCAEGEASPGEPQNAAFYRAAKLTGALFTSKSKTADEALVVLMIFYIGESTGGDLLHQVTTRGRRMLPLLLKYRTANVAFSGRTYPSSIFLPADVRNEDFEKAIKSVRTGKVLGED
jgi:hypothetical protein